MSDQDPEHQDIEYVGAPTEFADAQEVPEWVSLAAKILFFLPGALVTATTIPIIILSILLVCCVLLVLLVSAF
jgi:hypothetical protein